MARVRRLGPQAQPTFLLACTQPRVAWTCSVHRVCRRQRCTPYFQVAARRAACTRPCFRTARHDSGLVRTETIQVTRLVALRRALFRSTHGRRRHGHQSPFVLFPPRVFDARRRLAFSRYCHVVLGSTARRLFRLEVFEWRVQLGQLLGRWRGQAREPSVPCVRPYPLPRSLRFQQVVLVQHGRPERPLTRPTTRSTAGTQGHTWRDAASGRTLDICSTL